MKKYFKYALLLLLLCQPVSGFIQEKPALVASIERGLQAAAPSWKLSISDVLSNSFGYKQMMLLEGDEGSVLVYLDISRYVEENKKGFTEASEIYDASMRNHSVKSELPGLGDEALIWTGFQDGQEWAVIRIRKSRVYFEVLSMSAETAKRFARKAVQLCTDDKLCVSAVKD